MGMNPTHLTLLGDGVVRRVALSSGHPPAPRLIVLPHLVCHEEWPQSLVRVVTWYRLWVPESSFEWKSIPLPGQSSAFRNIFKH